ncbi:MAG: DUF1290 domain-containing protein [Clostridiales bacterium]|nr:DUF1290 domain-containing protein [Clostridiales bacterium]
MKNFKYLAIILFGVLGGILGYIAPIIPYTYSKYTAVAIIAALDSVFGGLSSSLQGKFNMKVFISGFFGNALIAIAIVALGVRLGVDIYLAAIIVFVQRMLVNFSIIRNVLLNKPSKRNEEKELI